MKSKLHSLPTLLIVGAITLCVLAGSALSQDTLTVGSAAGKAGETVEVPVYLRDASGTPLGVERPAGQRIQALTLQVLVSPPGAVTSAGAGRAGLTASLTPIFQASPAGPSSIGFVASFSEGSAPLLLVSNAPGLGGQVARLTLTLAPGLPNGTKVFLTPVLSSATTRLSNQAGTLSETVEAGSLALGSGMVTVGPHWGDANLDGALDVFDLVILANYVVGNAAPGIAPFLATAGAMNLNPAAGAIVDVFDLVILANHLVGNTPVLPVP